MFVFVHIGNRSASLTQVSLAELCNISGFLKTLTLVVRLHVVLPIFLIRPVIDLMKKQIKHTMVVCKLARQNIRFWY